MGIDHHSHPGLQARTASCRQRHPSRASVLQSASSLGRLSSLHPAWKLLERGWPSRKNLSLPCRLLVAPRGD